MTLNLATILRKSTLKYPSKDGDRDGRGNISYETLHANVQQFAGALARIGVRRGQHVALMLPNVPHFTIAYFAAQYLGAVVVPLNVLFTPDEIAYHLTDSDAVALVAWEGFFEQAKAGFDRVRSVQDTSSSRRRIRRTRAAPDGARQHDGADGGRRTRPRACPTRCRTTRPSSSTRRAPRGVRRARSSRTSTCSTTPSTRSTRAHAARAGHGVARRCCRSFTFSGRP